MEKYYKISESQLENLIADSMKAEALNLTETEMTEEYPIEKCEYYKSLDQLYFTDAELNRGEWRKVSFQDLARREIEMFKDIYFPLFNCDLVDKKE